MRNKELQKTNPLAPEIITSDIPSSTSMNLESNRETMIPNIDIPEECAEAFIAAVELGYHKAFYQQGLINAEEFDILLKLQKKKSDAKKMNAD